MDLGQEELRCLSSDPDVPGLLAGFWLSFPLELPLSPKKGQAGASSWHPTVGFVPDLCRVTGGGVCGPGLSSEPLVLPWCDL